MPRHSSPGMRVKTALKSDIRMVKPMPSMVRPRPKHGEALGKADVGQLELGTAHAQHCNHVRREG
eukprot:358664-Chlamydomonas_euryale.AAC.2